MSHRTSRLKPASWWSAPRDDPKKTFRPSVVARHLEEGAKY
jgi:hypothetical protein